MRIHVFSASTTHNSIIFTGPQLYTLQPTGYAGGTDALQEAVDLGWLGSLLAQELAASLLVGLKIQEGHLD